MLVTTSNFRSRQASMLSLADRGERIIIHRRNKPSYMLVPVQVEETYSVSPETQKMIDQSLQDFKEGRVKAFSTAADAQKWLEEL